jgi:hypothetical protein
VPVDDEAKKRNQSLPGQGGVFNLVNLHLYHYAGNNPVKYTDPDGKTPKTVLENHIESTTNAVGFLYQNKNAIQKIGMGVAKIAMGIGIAVLGTGGGGAITISSAGAAVSDGIAVTREAITAGGVYVGAGVKNVLDGIVMMSQSNGSGGNNQEYREKTRGANQNDRKQINSVAQEAKIDRRKFGDFVEQTKIIEGRGPSDNYTYQELKDLAQQFKEIQ